MSTVFDVFPTTDRIPTFNELLRLASDHLNSLLCTAGISRVVALRVELRDAHERVLPIDLDGPCWWSEGQYAWFHIPGLAGGTDAYAESLSEGRSFLLGHIGQRRGVSYDALVEKSLHIGRCWLFRRSAGQPALINMAYGVLAASLAEITDGFMDSADSAWDSSLLPARSPEFFEWFMRPSANSKPEWRDWSQRNLERAAVEIRQLPRS